MYKRILVPVDLDDTASALGSMSAAKQLCDLCGAEMTVLSLVPSAADKAAWESRIGDFVEGQRSVHVPKMKSEVRSGDAVGDLIVEAAADLKADLIVMATHDPTAPGAEMGSNAAHVLTHTPCSVLSVR